jgi:hypothetical protein
MPRNKKALTEQRIKAQQHSQAFLEKQNGYLKGELDTARNQIKTLNAEVASLKTSRVTSTELAEVFDQPVAK